MKTGGKEMDFLLMQGEYVLRMLLAAFCGAVIGYERRNRMKEAGIRTHLIVALGSALIMLVSKYGFFDLLPMIEDIKLDPSRIASQIVSGVGFLGAGMIFVRRQTISGLTTAAGIWATAGVGMAIGSGMYVIGIASTVAVFIMQTILHGKWFDSKLHIAEEISVLINDSTESIDYIKEVFSKEKIDILNMKVKKIPETGMDLKLFVRLPKGYDVFKLLDIFKDNKFVKSIDL